MIRQPIKPGDKYEDCTGNIAIAREVNPVLFTRSQVLWFWLTRRAVDFDIIGDYDPPLEGKPGVISNASWRNCGCEKVDR